MSVASTPSGSTPTGHLTTAPADYGPTHNPHRTTESAAYLDRLNPAGYCRHCLTRACTDMACITAWSTISWTTCRTCHGTGYADYPAAAATGNPQDACTRCDHCTDGVCQLDSISAAANAPTRANWIKRARLARGWSNPRLIREIRRIAADAGITLPGNESLTRTACKWQSGESTPSEFYAEILRRIFDRPRPVNSPYPSDLRLLRTVW